MARSHDQLRVRLVQVRTRPDIIAEEQASFCTRTELRPDQLVVTDALSDPMPPSLLDDVDAVLIGGAGAFSVTQTYSWTDELINLCQACAERRMPLFGSCWGHQFIARAFGGVVIADPLRAEMGTREVSLTPVGSADPLFEPFPSRFMAQMGHQDRVAQLPDGAHELATSPVAPFQAFRLDGLPIYGTQFHSELDRQAEYQRLVAYRAHYPEMANDDAFNETLASLQETPEVDGLLHRFLTLFAVEDADR